jgi:DNA topoisomerase II
MIFGHLRTSSNYDTSEKKIVGGKNGFGFKLVLIWSTYGKVETVDHVRGLSYVQEFRDNLNAIGEPVIRKVAASAKPFTRVTFTPDYRRLGMPDGLTADMIQVFKKRLYDIAAVTENKDKDKDDGAKRKLKITYCAADSPKTLVPVRSFKQYVDMYLTDETQKQTQKQAYEVCGPRWEYSVALSPTHQFEQVSFVNGICTFKGGKHVDYLINQITKKIQAYIEAKKKQTVNLNMIKEQLIIFVRADIENPSFDSQTKDYMNTPSSKFGSTCVVSDAFIEKIAKMGVMCASLAISQIKDTKIASKTDGSKTKNIRGIANFIDANYAGTASSSKCTLILCEGLSAMSGVLGGLSGDDKNKYGIYPLKGKLLNVRGENARRIGENKEIADLKKILGLETGKKYKTQEDVHKYLRYAKIMILTDADNDGIHIRGLCVNLFESEWPSLFQISGFLSFMNTPILKASKAGATVSFYNQGEYDLWARRTQDHGSWAMKYLKGLGSSTSVEFKQYFANNKIVDFQFTESSSDVMDKVFNKKRADERKHWLEHYDKNDYLNTSFNHVTYDDFVDRELIHFSIYDCQRNIPSLVDGLKTSQRKILWCAFRRNLTHDIKVAQFSGYISEHSHYLHGEKSLHTTTISMAQTFVGSNNINLLLPHGQFGTRFQGGSDSASERYIFTHLSPIARHIFHEADDAGLRYLSDDNHLIEPEYYIPVIPLVLINGIAGIGTGFSTNLPPFNPLDVIRYLQMKLQSRDSELASFSFVPYYRDFKGTVAAVEHVEHKFTVAGLYEIIDDTTLHISELPVGTWTMPYILFLDGLLDLKKIKDFVNNSTEHDVDIRITLFPGHLVEMQREPTGIHKFFKLTTSLSTANMHLFDAHCVLKKYHTVTQIIEDFYHIRLCAYEKRKQLLMHHLQLKSQKLWAKYAYIRDTISNKIDIRNKTAHEIEAMLSHLVKDNGSHEYLLHMPMVSVSEEHSRPGHAVQSRSPDRHRHEHTRHVGARSRRIAGPVPEKQRHRRQGATPRNGQQGGTEQGHGQGQGRQKTQGAPVTQGAEKKKKKKKKKKKLFIIFYIKFN